MTPTVSASGGETRTNSIISSVPQEGLRALWGHVQYATSVVFTSPGRVKCFNGICKWYLDLNVPLMSLGHLPAPSNGSSIMLKVITKVPGQCLLQYGTGLCVGRDMTTSSQAPCICIIVIRTNWLVLIVYVFPSLSTETCSVHVAPAADFPLSNLISWKTQPWKKTG